MWQRIKGYLRERRARAVVQAELRKIWTRSELKRLSIEYPPFRNATPTNPETLRRKG